MVEYSQWTAIAFELAADDVSQQRVISRAAQIWNARKTEISNASMSEAREIGRRTL